jgi:hypothetical protein
MSSLLHYLHKGDQRYENLDLELNLKRLQLPTISTAITKLIERVKDDAIRTV